MLLTKHSCAAVLSKPHAAWRTYPSGRPSRVGASLNATPTAVSAPHTAAPSCTSCGTVSVLGTVLISAAATASSAAEASCSTRPPPRAFGAASASSLAAGELRGVCSLWVDIAALRADRVAPGGGAGSLALGERR